MTSNSDRLPGLISSNLHWILVFLAVVAVGFGLTRQLIRTIDPAAEQFAEVPVETSSEQFADQPGILSPPVDVPSVPITAELEAAAKANSQFAIALYRRLGDRQPGQNVFLSPFPVSTILAMASEGAADQTREQMIDVLHVPPGGLAPFHVGQRDLQRALVPVIPPELTRRINALRARLKSSNDRIVAFKKNRHFQPAAMAFDKSHKLALEINRLVKQVAAYELQISNALWLENSCVLNPGFVSTVKSNYGPAFFPVDFKGHPEPVRLHINQWVAEQTQQRIQDLLSPGTITDQTRMVLTNTVYFRGDWAVPFEAANTRRQAFRLPDQRSGDVDMMEQWNSESASYAAFRSNGELFPSPLEIPFKIRDDDPSLYPDEQGYTMLALDYQGSKIQMIVLLPQSVSGLAALEKSLSPVQLQRDISQLRKRNVHLLIPKFKLATRYILNNDLRALGMVRPFEIPRKNGEGAQFSRLVSDSSSAGHFYISQVVHQTYLDVNEVGTEAAAAVSLDLVEAFEDEVHPFTPIFKADRPFLFLIRDRDTATILFIGRYASPNP